MNCTICKSSKIKDYKKINFYKLYKCLRCGVIFLDNDSLILDEKELYDKQYFETYLYETDIHLENTQKAVKYYLEFIQRNFFKPQSILEVGAGFGYMVKALRSLGYDAEGIEVSGYSVEEGKKRLNIDLFKGTLTSYPKDKKFDLIIFYHSFEHINNPIETLAKVNELLNKSGILWLSFPNVMSLDRFLNGDRWNGWSLPYHLFHYSPRSIKYLLKNSGFSNVKVVKSFLNPFSIIRKKVSKNLISHEATREKQVSILKEFIRKPATFIFSGQNMNVFAQKTF